MNKVTFVVDPYPFRAAPERRFDGRPQMGEWCILHGVALKRHDRQATRSETFDVTWEHGVLTATPAMYIGYRHVYSGVRFMDGDADLDGAPAFRKTDTHEVWIFVTSARTNPIRVFPDQVAKWRESAR